MSSVSPEACTLLKRNCSFYGKMPAAVVAEIRPLNYGQTFSSFTVEEIDFTVKKCAYYGIKPLKKRFLNLKKTLCYLKSC